jgi:hypothetical protein
VHACCATCKSEHCLSGSAQGVSASCHSHADDLAKKHAPKSGIKLVGLPSTLSHQDMFWPIGNIQGATRPRPYLPQKALDKLRDMPALDLDEPVVEPVHVQLHPLTLGGGWTGHCMP